MKWKFTMSCRNDNLQNNDGIDRGRGECNSMKDFRGRETCLRLIRTRGRVIVLNISYQVWWAWCEYAREGGIVVLNMCNNAGDQWNWLVHSKRNVISINPNSWNSFVSRSCLGRNECWKCKWSRPIWQFRYVRWWFVVRKPFNSVIGILTCGIWSVFLFVCLLTCWFLRTYLVPRTLWEKQI